MNIPQPISRTPVKEHDVPFWYISGSVGNFGAGYLQDMTGKFAGHKFVGDGNYGMEFDSYEGAVMAFKSVSKKVPGLDVSGAIIGPFLPRADVIRLAREGRNPFDRDQCPDSLYLSHWVKDPNCQCRQCKAEAAEEKDREHLVHKIRDTSTNATQNTKLGGSMDARNLAK